MTGCPKCNLIFAILVMVTIYARGENSAKIWASFVRNWLAKSYVLVRFVRFSGAYCAGQIGKIW